VEVEKAVAEKKVESGVTVHPKVAKKLTEIANQVKSDPELDKKANAAYAEYKKNPNKLQPKPEVLAKAQNAWQKLHKDVGVKPSAE